MKGCLQAQFNATKILCLGFHISPVVLFLACGPRGFTRYWDGGSQMCHGWLVASEPWTSYVINDRPEVSFCHWVPLICFVLWQLHALFFSYRILHCLVNGFVAVFLSWILWQGVNETVSLARHQNKNKTLTGKKSVFEYHGVFPFLPIKEEK